MILFLIFQAAGESGLTLEQTVKFIIGLAAFLGACAVIYKYVIKPLKKAWESIKTIDKIFTAVKEISVVFDSAKGETLPNTINAINTTLAELQAMVELILSNSSTATYLMDDKGLCTYVNEAWSAITGLSRDKAMGNGWTKAIHDDDRRRVYDEWTDSRGDDRPFVSDFRFVNQQTGKVSNVRASSVGVKNKKMIIVAYIGEIKILLGEQ